MYKTEAGYTGLSVDDCRDISNMEYFGLLCISKDLSWTKLVVAQTLRTNYIVFDTLRVYALESHLQGSETSSKILFLQSERNK